MPEVSREFTVEQPVEKTWDFFLTPEKLAPCVPGCERVEEIEEDVFDVDVSVDVAYTNLTFNTTVEITNKEPPTSLDVAAEASPKGRMPGSANVDGGLDFEEVNETTTDGSLTIEFSIFGRLGTFGESAFRHKCEEITDQFLENVREELESEPVEQK